MGDLSAYKNYDPDKRSGEYDVLLYAPVACAQYASMHLKDVVRSGCSRRAIK